MDPDEKADAEVVVTMEAGENTTAAAGSVVGDGKESKEAADAVEIKGKDNNGIVIATEENAGIGNVKDEGLIPKGDGNENSLGGVPLEGGEKADDVADEAGEAEVSENAAATGEIPKEGEGSENAAAVCEIPMTADEGVVEAAASSDTPMETDANGLGEEAPKEGKVNVNDNVEAKVEDRLTIDNIASGNADDKNDMAHEGKETLPAEETLDDDDIEFLEELPSRPKEEKRDGVKVEVPEIKAEPKMSSTNGNVEDMSADSDVKVKVELKAEGNVKEESGVEPDSYLVLDETDGSNENEVDSDETDEDELTEVEQLRKTNAHLNKRICLLEEFIELEFGDKFESFMKKRERLVDVMGIDDQQGQVQNGTRSSKSKELVGLLKIVKDQASSANNGSGRTNAKPKTTPPQGETRRTRRPRNRNSAQKSPAKSSGSTGQASNSTTRGRDNHTTKTTSSSTSADKPKKCHRCHMDTHLLRNCPYKHSKYPPPEVAAIKRDGRRERRRKLREENEANPELRNLRVKRRRLNRSITKMRSTQQQR